MTNFPRNCNSRIFSSRALFPLRLWELGLIQVDSGDLRWIWRFWGMHWSTPCSRRQQTRLRIASSQLRKLGRRLFRHPALTAQCWGDRPFLRQRPTLIPVTSDNSRQSSAHAVIIGIDKVKRNGLKVRRINRKLVFESYTVVAYKWWRSFVGNFYLKFI